MAQAVDVAGVYGRGGGCSALQDRIGSAAGSPLDKRQTDRLRVCNLVLIPPFPILLSSLEQLVELISSHSRRPDLELPKPRPTNPDGQKSTAALRVSPHPLGRPSRVRRDALTTRPHATMKATPLIINWHDQNQPIYSAHFEPSAKGRLATAGGDTNVRVRRPHGPPLPFFNG